jgi:putative ABC transport system permease protein
MARRELRSGIKGFRIFLACLALGVAAIAGVGSISKAILEGLANEGRTILGGDVDLALTHRPAEQNERSWLDANTAEVSETAQMRSMARRSRNDEGERTLVELKAVDHAYPIYGRVELGPDLALQDAISRKDGRWGAVVDRNLLSRLDVAVGDEIRLGDVDFIIRAAINREPDRMATGMALGPRVLITRGALTETGLYTLGSLITFHYRVALNQDRTTDEDLIAWKDEADETFPDAGWRMQDRTNGAPGVRQFVLQVTVFLTLVGLTALVVGGVGVGNAVKSYMDGKRQVVATLKCIGATGSMIFQIYLAQVLALAAVGVVIGLAVGACLPFLVMIYFGDRLPVPAEFAVYWEPLLVAAIFGFVVATAFAIWPLARAQEIPAANIFRDLVSPTRALPPRRYLVGLAISFAILIALAVLTTPYKAFALWFVLGVAISFVVLHGVAWSVMRLAAKAGRPKNAALRLALANLHRPGAPTVSVVLSLGLGITLLVTVSLIDGNIRQQVTQEIPEEAPSFFFVDIQTDQVDAFDDLLLGTDGVSNLQRVPSLRGQIKMLNGVLATPENVDPEARWALRGDRGVTYSSEAPGGGSTVVEGEWWPKDYSGPPLISFSQEFGQGFGLKVGDTMTIRVLGRDIKGTIANFRQIDFSSAELNFTIVFSPGVFDGAPHTHIATARTTPEIEEDVQRAVTDAFPNITVVSIRRALETVEGMLDDLIVAVRAASAVTIFSGVFVLAGAMASGHRSRRYDSVVLKVVGASRMQVLKSYVIEYAILGAGTAVIAGFVGYVAAYLVVTQVMDGEWVSMPITLLATVLSATLVTISLGLVGSWRVLGASPAPVLRAE